MAHIGLREIWFLLKKFILQHQTPQQRTGSLRRWDYLGADQDLFDDRLVDHIRCDPVSSRMYTCDRGGTVTSVDGSTDVVTTVYDAVCSMDMHLAGGLIYFTDILSTFNILDVRAPRGVLRSHIGGTTSSLHSNPLQQFQFATSMGEYVRVWDIRMLPSHPNGITVDGVFNCNHKSHLTSARYSSTGVRLLKSTIHGDLIMFQAQDSSFRQISKKNIDEHSYGNRRVVQWDPRDISQRIVAAGVTNAIKFVDIQTTRIVHILRTPEAVGHRFHPHDDVVASLRPEALTIWKLPDPELEE